MSTQKGNVKKSGPPKYQNRHGFKNVYHDTSKQTQKIVTTEVSGVCKRCKDVIDWKIKYKKYKALSRGKTCATCKQKTVKQAYLVFCQACSAISGKCAKCGDSTDIVQKPSKSAAEIASEDRELQFELEQLPERKRRTFLRLQEKGLPSDTDASSQLSMRNCASDDDSDHGDSESSETCDPNKSLPSGNEQPNVETDRDLENCQSELLNNHLHLHTELSEINN